MKALTIIITFANEANLLRSTVQNISSTIDTQLSEILLIDDASSDQYDYKSMAQEFGARYFRNCTRKGVARSREIGIALCETDFFLLLDGHMKAYTPFWDEKLITYGKNNKNVLFCCQTSSIDLRGNIIKDRQPSFGAYINTSELLVKWNYVNYNPNKTIEHIPCVLGGAYFCSRSFWRDFGGLIGLNGYGFDEQVMSLRVWKNRGKCCLLKDICFGHYYRKITDTPYEIDKFCYTKNKFLTSGILNYFLDLCDIMKTTNLDESFCSLHDFWNLNNKFEIDNKKQRK